LLSDGNSTKNTGKEKFPPSKQFTMLSRLLWNLSYVTEELLQAAAGKGSKTGCNEGHPRDNLVINAGPLYVCDERVFYKQSTWRY